MKYSVSVRALCEFTAKAGDLDRRFTPAPTAQQGREGHALIGNRRGAGYEREIRLEAEQGILRVRGRADGYAADTNQLEEFKTYRGELSRMPDNHRALHWAQLKTYGALLCQARGLEAVTLALVYLNIESEEETTLVEHCGVAELLALFQTRCAAFCGWAEQELAHRARRDSALAALQFPFSSFHVEQRRLAEAVYRAVRRRQQLLAEAPTGSGKTIATLFPALKAMPGAGLDKLFFLAAKNSGRVPALEALRAIQPDSGLRVLELVSREKACEYPGRECHGASCPLARGFYDRMASARAAAVEAGFLDRAMLRSLALAHEICPYYLAQELVYWADVIVGDYHYFFARAGLLYELSVAADWKVSVLVDEGHNLLERAREMYSATLSQRALEAAREAAPPPLERSLMSVVRCWSGLMRTHSSGPEYQTLTELPVALMTAMESYLGDSLEYSANEAHPPAESVLAFQFETLRFLRLAESLDEDTILDLVKSAPGDSGEGASLTLRNVFPARFLKSRWEAANSLVLFSATLTPFPFYRDMFGLPEDIRTLAVDSQFKAEQLQVRIVRDISTRWTERSASVQPIATLIARQFSVEPGNYLAFFSSFQYLQAVALELSQLRPDIPQWHQKQRMSEADRNAFIGRFQPESSGIGFAVLGGAFGEGIDLPGRRLAGAFISTLGLPQVCEVRAEMQRRLAARFGTGFEYAYLYPGLQKVVQAAGRVIRTHEDTGSIFLIDERFAEPRVRRLLPKWWQLPPSCPTRWLDLIRVTPRA